MAHTRKTLTTLGAAALTLVASAAAAPQSTAGGTTEVSVTIKAEGTDLSGKVISPVASCAAERKVVVWKVKGTRGGGDDKRFASDTTDLQGGDYVWSTGNTGTEGRFYARVKALGSCEADASRTVRAQRDD